MTGYLGTDERKVHPMRRALAVAVLMAASAGLTAGCSDADASCKTGNCRLTLTDGGSLTLDGQTLTVKRIDDDHITFDSHGVDLTLSRTTELAFGRYHLTFGRVDGGSATVDVSK